MVYSKSKKKKKKKISKKKQNKKNSYLPYLFFSNMLP